MLANFTRTFSCRMRNILIATALILLNTGILPAQQTGTITGSVVDSETGDLLAYSQVALYTWPDSDFVPGTITNDEGVFSLDEVVVGQYQAVISFLGYNPMSQAPIDISSNSLSADLGAIGLALNITALNEVTVTGQASTTSRKIEKQVYNADQFVTARGGTGLE